MKAKKTPLRKCVVTQEMLNKRELIRVVRTPEGEVKLDPTGKASGRGAYISRTMEAFETAKKKKLLNRALKMDVTDEMYNLLEEEFKRIVAQ
ncbi:YlxR family protein [Aneurinibacillus sp. Ricciae_BoGa-3]|uniref:RNase P modulator RnpM n=1 Tax=Aneurinibacillus sp. Ricciae_BoGa-3 TaxID=3022697 RepID=UPI00234120AA|nr:YlxR family protein [Aneurinibacillus sp. Ricciae_BoGa-3]WCK52856.1 YlxR family protein [Aneurinibacillus sp. Ricciae_BoGa-3]